MTLSLLRARIGALVRGGLVALALLLAAACGKKPSPEPAPRPQPATESEKTEARRPIQTEKKKAPPPALSDLRPVEGAAWDIAPEPAPPLKGPFNLRDEIPFEPEVVVPSTPSPFVAIAVARAKAANTYRVYDLRTMNAIGVRVPLPACTALALSPDGQFLAGRLEDQPAVVEAWSTQTGQSAFRHDFTPDKLTPSDVDLPGAGRLWVAEPGQKAQLWGLADGKPLPAPGAAPPRERRAFTPGGRHLLAVAKGDNTLITVHDLKSGQTVGQRRFEAPAALAGAPAALAVSPDGEEIALLWRLDRPAGEEWGRLVCWGLKTGQKLHEHAVPSFETIDVLWPAGKRVLQFWPGRNGWMLFGHLLIDRESGAVVHRLALPRNAGDLQDRRFLDAAHVTEARNRLPRRLKVMALPRKEIDEAVKEARGKGR